MQVESNPIEQPDKIKQCGCKEKLESFHKGLVYVLYSNGINPIEFKKQLDTYKRNMLKEIEPTGIDSDFLQKELDLLLNEISAKASSKTGLSVSEFKIMLDASIVKIIQFINSPEFKTFGSKSKLASFCSDLKIMLEKSGLTAKNFEDEINKFVDDVLSIVKEAELDPYLLKQQLDELKKQLDTNINSKTKSSDPLKDKFEEFIKNLTKAIDDPEFSKVTVQNYMDDFENELYTAIEAYMIPLMSQFKIKPEDQEYYKGLGKETVMSYMRYLVSLRIISF